MKAITRVFKDLMTPDDQAESWYGWACNQLAHAFLGAVVAVLSGQYWIFAVLVFACLKETFDLIKKFNYRGILDSLNDVCFWMCGGFIVSVESGHLFFVLIMFSLLSFGVYERVKK